MDLKFKTMKKLFITAAIATMFSVTAFADGGKKATTETSEKGITFSALNHFKSDFKSADNVVWTTTANCQKVTFVENNVSYTAFYNLGGEYLGVTRALPFEMLAPSVKKEITEKYKAYTVSSVIQYKTQDSDEAVVYFVDVKSTDSEIVLKVSANEVVSFFKTVK